MYRTSAEEKRKSEKTGSMVLEAKDRERTTKASMALLQVFTVPVVGALLLSVIFTQTIAVIGFGLLAGLTAWWWWQKRSNSERATIYVDNGVVELDVKPQMQRFGLDDVLDVSLETKTIQPIQLGGSAIPIMRVIDAKVAPDVDTSRVVLTIRGRRTPIRMHDEFLSYGDATECLGKVRVFLRKHGWEPLSERTATNEHEPDDEEDVPEEQHSRS